MSKKGQSSTCLIIAMQNVSLLLIEIALFSGVEG